MIIVGTIIAAIISAAFYRMGGMSGMNTKIRDLGCPTVALAWMILFFPKTFAVWHFLAFGAMFGALTTYWDSVFGWDNFYMHGFVIGLAYLFYGVLTGIWIPILARAVVLAVFMGLINYLANKYQWKHSDWWEECLRGFSIVATLPLLLL